MEQFFPSRHLTSNFARNFRPENLLEINKGIKGLSSNSDSCIFSLFTCSRMPFTKSRMSDFFSNKRVRLSRNLAVILTLIIASNYLHSARNCSTVILFFSNSSQLTFLLIFNFLLKKRKILWREISEFKPASLNGGSL